MQRQQAMMKFVDNINSCPEVRCYFARVVLFVNYRSFFGCVLTLVVFYFNILFQAINELSSWGIQLDQGMLRVSEAN